MNENTLMNDGSFRASCHAAVCVMDGGGGGGRGWLEREAPLTQDVLLLDETQAACSLLGNFNLATTSDRSTCITFKNSFNLWVSCVLSCSVFRHVILV